MYVCVRECQRESVCVSAFCKVCYLASRWPHGKTCRMKIFVVLWKFCEDLSTERGKWDVIGLNWAALLYTVYCWSEEELCNLPGGERCRQGGVRWGLSFFIYPTCRSLLGYETSEKPDPWWLAKRLPPGVVGDKLNYWSYSTATFIFPTQSSSTIFSTFHLLTKFNSVIIVQFPLVTLTNWENQHIKVNIYMKIILYRKVVNVSLFKLSLNDR